MNSLMILKSPHFLKRVFSSLGEMAEIVDRVSDEVMAVDAGEANVAEVPKERERPSFESIYMKLAELMSQRSTCDRLSVGTVITTTDFRKVLSCGFNGNASGLPNKCDSSVPGSCGSLHAEINAVINCDTPRYVDKYVFVTHSPCIMCAKVLINLGNVKRIYYKNEYRDTSSIAILNSVGIETVHLQ